MTVCTVEDDFIREKTKWVATLSNGVRVYQDDGRSGLEEPSAWIRLRKYTHENKLQVDRVELQFWDHVETVVETRDASGVFFVQGVYATLFTGPTSTRSFYIFGTAYKQSDDQYKILTSKWLVPELIPIESGQRVVNKDDPTLILNPENV